MIMYLTRPAADAYAKRHPGVSWKYDVERELLRVYVDQVVWESLVSERRVSESESDLVLRVMA